MSKITQTDYPTFIQMYKALPERKVVKAPKTEFVERIARVTLKSKKTVYCWINGSQSPDPLTQSVIEKELGVPASCLFPQKTK